MPRPDHPRCRAQNRARNRTSPILALLATVCLAAGTVACTGQEPTPALGPERPCDAQAGAEFIGQRWSDELGPALQRATGARTLRPTFENAPVTMDFIPHRLTISYDDTLIITRLNCG